MIFYVFIGSAFYILSALPVIFGSDYVVSKCYNISITAKSNIKEKEQVFLELYSQFQLPCLLWWYLLIFGIGKQFIILNTHFRYLAITGQTTIEFWMRRPQDRARDDFSSRISDFRQPSKLRNLEYIFGTTNVFKMFLPSMKKLKHDGINWESYINRHIV